MSAILPPNPRSDWKTRHMKRILVGVKQVLDYSTRVRVKPDASGVATDAARFSTNPFDEIALEEALRLREQGFAEEVLAVSIGPEQVQAVLRTALAMGADRALHVACDEPVEPLDVAALMLKLVEREQPSLVLLGKQAVDDDNSQVGQMLAALWGRPQATFASRIVAAGPLLQVTREVDAGLEQVEVELPAVVTADLRLNQPRYVKLPDIIKAKKKPLEVVPVATLGVALRQRVKILRHDAPPPRQPGVRVKDVPELVDALHARGVL